MVMLLWILNNTKGNLSRVSVTEWIVDIISIVIIKQQKLKTFEKDPITSVLLISHCFFRSTSVLFFFLIHFWLINETVTLSKIAIVICPRVDKSLLLIWFYVPISWHVFTKHIMFPAWMGKQFSALTKFIIKWTNKTKLHHSMNYNWMYNVPYG